MERMDDIEEEEEELEEKKEPADIYSILNTALQSMAPPKTLCIKIEETPDFSYYPSILTVSQSREDIMDNLKEFSKYAKENNGRLLHNMFINCLDPLKYRKKDGTMHIYSPEELISAGSPIQLCKFTLFYDPTEYPGEDDFTKLKLIPTTHSIDRTELPVLNPDVFNEMPEEYKIYIKQLIYFSIINSLIEIFTKIVPSDLLERDPKSICFSFDYYPARKTYLQEFKKAGPTTLELHKDMSDIQFDAKTSTNENVPYISLLFINESEHGVDLPMRGTSVICDQAIVDPACRETYIFTPEIRSGYSITFNDSLLTHSTPITEIASSDKGRTMEITETQKRNLEKKKKQFNPLKEEKSTHLYMLSELSHESRVPRKTIQQLIEDPAKKRTFIRTHYIFNSYNPGNINLLTRNSPIGVHELKRLSKFNIRHPNSIIDILKIFAPSRDQLDQDISELYTYYDEYYRDNEYLAELKFDESISYIEKKKIISTPTPENVLPEVDVSVLISDISELNDVLKGLQEEFGFGKSKNRKNKTKYKRNRNKNRTKKRNKRNKK